MGDQYLAVTVTEISKFYNLSYSDIQKKFQGMLTNALSHERLTPLNSIINLSAMILSEAIDESVYEKVKVIQASAEVLQKMTKSQLDHLAINTKKYEFTATKPLYCKKGFEEYLN
jgi:signal transduction histidine kinase